MAKIKICGLSRLCDIEYVNELGPEYIGYVFWDRSRRNVSMEQADKLTGHLMSHIIPVGVFVDAEPELPATLLKEGIIRAVQLHGHEDEEYIKRLRELTFGPENATIIKAFKVKSVEDVQRANSFPADYVLLDNGYGTGHNFDWQYVPAAQRAFFLAGGLNADNVSEAINELKPYAVDISSGVETDGYKDFYKIKEFIEAARR